MSTIMLTTVFMPLGLPAIAVLVLGVGWLIMSGCYFYRVPFGRISNGYKLFLAIIFGFYNAWNDKKYFCRKRQTFICGT